MTHPGAPYFSEVLEYIEQNLDDVTAITVTLLAILTDGRSYLSAKDGPQSSLRDYAHELALTDQDVRAFLASPDTPVSRKLIDDKWAMVWRNARGQTERERDRKYPVCISFAGEDRAIARAIADELVNEHELRVFYDEFESNELWGEDLYTYLYNVYSQQSYICVILFSHAYRTKAWTRHELRSAQTRLLNDQSAHIYPVAIDRDAIPAEFGTISYWRYEAGDEPRIAAAINDKFVEFAQSNFITLEEMTASLSRHWVEQLTLQGFRMGIAERPDDSDEIAPLQLLAVVAAANCDALAPSYRAMIELILYSSEPVAAMFGDDGRAQVFGNARVLRWPHQDGPLMMTTAGWSEYMNEETRKRDERLAARYGDDDEDDQDDDEDDHRHGDQSDA